MDSTSPSLLERARNPHDTKARERLAEYCGGFILHWARRFTANEEEALDFVQDVFVKLFEHLPDFVYDPKRSFRGWLFTVMENLRNERWRKVQIPRDGAAHLSDIPDSAEGSDVDEQEFRRHVVERALRIMQNDFEQRTWQACWELVVNGKTGEEVAEQSGMTVPAVYKAKSKVLRRLRQELDGLLD